MIQGKKLQALKYAIVTKHATAVEFEEAIKEQGLTGEVIALLQIYYTESDIGDELKTARQELGLDLRKLGL